MCCIDNSTWRGLAALLILEEGQCEGLTAGMGEKLETPMPFLFPYLILLLTAEFGSKECNVYGNINIYNLKQTIMKKRNFLWSVLAYVMAVTFCVGFIGCGGGDDPAPTPNPINPNNPDNPNVTASIKVNGALSTSLTFEGDFAGKSGIDYKQSVAISSTVQWTMSKDADWLNVSPSNGSGTLEMVIFPTSENLSSTDRTATITLSGSGVSATISVTQHAGFDAELQVSPNTIVTLADGFAFDFSFGSKVKYYYVSRYLPSALDRKTDSEIIAEMSSNDTNRDTPTDGYVTSWRNQSPLTEYIICTVGYDANGKHGALTKTNVKTKSSSNQAAAYISDVKYSDTNWSWTTTVNGYVSKYYMWFITNTKLYDSTDAAIAWFFNDAMKKNPSNFAPIAQGDTWTAARNGSSIFHVATWAVGVDGNFSGIIDRFAGSINSSPAKSMVKNYVEKVDESKRFKTFK